MWVRRGGCFFFFQAEDGIRDYKVTGVQTCALPIYTGADQQVRVDWNASLQPRTTLSRPRSCGYWLSASAQPAVDRLRLLGLQVLKVAEPGQLLADSYNEARSATPASGAYAQIGRASGRERV